MLRFTRILLCFCLTGGLLLSSGCTKRARAERHVQRGDESFAKGDMEKAKLEYLNAVRKGIRDARVMGRLGEMFLKSGELQQAASFLIQARNSEPTNNVVRHQLTSIFMAVGRPDLAHEEVDVILKTAPKDAQALVVLAQTSTAKEAIDSARARIEALQASYPQNGTIPFCLGLLSQNAREYPAAVSFFKKAVAQDPKQSRFQLALADLSNASGDLATAETAYKAAVAQAPVKSWERLRYAEFLNHAQRVEEAEKLLEDTVNKAPDFARAVNLLTEILITRNKLAEAAKRNAQGLALGPTQRDPLLNRARLKLAQRDIAGALKELEDLVKSFPKDAAVHYAYATAQLANGDRSKALASLGTAVGFDPNHIQAVLLRAELQLQQRLFNDAIPDLTRITKEFPQSAAAWFLLARAYRERRSFDEALTIYDQLIKGLPSDPRPLFNKGQTYLEMSNRAEARAAFNSCLLVNPDFYQAIEELTNLDIAEKKTDAAAARLQPYLQKYTNNAALMILQAKTLAYQGKVDDAFKVAQKATEVAPDNYVAQRALADLYTYTGKRDEAISRYLVIVKKNPKDDAAALQLGLLQEAAKDYKGARATYDGLLEAFPDHAIALNNLANIVADNFGEIDKGFEYSRRARELAPREPAIADTYGWALLRQGDYAQALPVLEEAIQKLADFPEVQYHLGMAYYMTGSEQQAAAALELAVKSGKDFVGKDRAQSALAILKINPANAAPETIQALQKAAKERPTDLMARLRLAQIFESQKQWENANQSYQEALRINPKSTNAYVRLVDLSFTFGHPQQGIELAKQLWTLAPDGALGAFLGPLGYKAGDYKWALTVLSEARRVRPNDGRLVFFQAASTYALGDLNKAKALFDESAKSAQNPAPLGKLGTALVSQEIDGKFSPDVAKLAAEALRQDAAFAPALIVSGLLAEGSGNFPEARSRYEQVLSTQPNHLTAQRLLGLVLAEKLSDDVKAGQLLADVKRELPADSLMNKALGKISYRRGDYKEAVRLLNEAAVTLSNDADLLYHLGMSQYRLNDREAKISLGQALKLDPKSQLAASAQKAMDELK